MRSIPPSDTVNPDPTKFSFHISKALNDDGDGTASSVLVGIEGCINSGSRIISMSLGGGPSSDILREVYEEAYDRGLLAFGASGNLGLRMDDYPASYPTVVSVGAVGPDGQRANFSNWNGQLEIMGPGVDIVSTFPGNRYGSLSGTSMAVPYVAGIAALIWGYFPECSNQQIRNVLAASARVMTPAGSGRRCDRRTGFGLVQAKDAFDLLDEYGCDAGGADYDPPSEGAAGGCSQPLADLTALAHVNEVDSDSDAGDGDLCQTLTLRLVTDDYAYETSWELIDGSGAVLDAGPIEGDGGLQKNTLYEGSVGGCLEPGIYRFTIRGESVRYDIVRHEITQIYLIVLFRLLCADRFGDGIEEPGSYSIDFNGNVFETNNDFGSSETTRFVVGIPNDDRAEDRQKSWSSVLYEDFDSGLGKFVSGGYDAMYTADRFGRNGLVMIKHGIDNSDEASITSENISLDDPGGFTKFKVVFSFYASNIGAGDGFCLDYRADEVWTEANCWPSVENGKWNDEVTWGFQPGLARSIAIRFRGFSSDDMKRIFIDKIQLYGGNQ